MVPGGTSAQQDFLLSRTLRDQRQWFTTKLEQLESAKPRKKQRSSTPRRRRPPLRREVAMLQAELARFRDNERKEKMATAFRTGVLGMMVKETPRKMPCSRRAGAART